MFLRAKITSRGTRGTGTNRPRPPRPAPLTSRPRRGASGFGGGGRRAGEGGTRAQSLPHPPRAITPPPRAINPHSPHHDNYPPPPSPPATIPPSHRYPSLLHRPPHAAPAILRRAAFVPVGPTATRPRSARRLPHPLPVGGVRVWGEGSHTPNPRRLPLPPAHRPRPAVTCCLRAARRTVRRWRNASPPPFIAA